MLGLVFSIRNRLSCAFDFLSLSVLTLTLYWNIPLSLYLNFYYLSSCLHDKVMYVSFSLSIYLSFYISCLCFNPLLLILLLISIYQAPLPHFPILLGLNHPWTPTNQPPPPPPSSPTNGSDIMESTWMIARGGHRI